MQKQRVTNHVQYAASRWPAVLFILASLAIANPAIGQASDQKPTQRVRLGDERTKEIEVTAGGRQVDDGKTCYYETRTVAPTVSLHFFAKHETGELHIFGTGEKQIALKAVAPDGTTLTSRFESSGPRLSHVVFDDPEDGAYEIWVGGCGYSSAPASIVLSEFPPSDSWVERGKRKRN